MFYSYIFVKTQYRDEEQGRVCSAKNQAYNTYAILSRHTLTQLLLNSAFYRRITQSGSIFLHTFTTFFIMSSN